MSNREEKKLCKESMAQALIKLCNEKELSEITISEICNKAGVSRMAFYRSFKNKEDIFKSYFDSILTEFLDTLNPNYVPGSFHNMDNLIYTFNYFKQYSELIICLRKIHLGDLLLNNVIQYELKKYYKDKDNAKFYTLIAYAGSIYSVYVLWLERDFEDEVSNLAQYIYDIYKDVYL